MTSSQSIHQSFSALGRRFQASNVRSRRLSTWQAFLSSFSVLKTLWELRHISFQLLHRRLYLLWCQKGVAKLLTCDKTCKLNKKATCSVCTGSRASQTTIIYNKVKVSTQMQLPFNGLCACYIFKIPGIFISNDVYFIFFNGIALRVLHFLGIRNHPSFLVSIFTGWESGT